MCGTFYLPSLVVTGDMEIDKGRYFHYDALILIGPSRPGSSGEITVKLREPLEEGMKITSSYIPTEWIRYKH